jgi:hypothetical protein
VEIQGGSVASFVTMLAAASLLLALACAAAWNAPARQPGERLAPFSTEMVLLVTASTTIALVLASILLRYSAQVMVVPTPGLTVRGGAFTLLIAAIAATFLVAIRSSKTPPNDERRILPVVTQAAIALPLVMFAATTVRDANDLKTTSPGFDVESTVATRIHLPATRYSSHHAVSAFEAALTQRLRSMDGIESAGLTSSLPLTGFDGCSGVAVDNRAGNRCVPMHFVSPDYLRALGVPVSGRYAATSEEVIVSAAFARRTWPGVDPIGRTISPGPSAGSYQVVGVAADVRSRGLDREPADDVYMPMTPRGGLSGWPPITDHMLVVRSSHADKRVVRQLVLDAIRTVDESVEAGATRTMSEIVAADTAHRNLPVSFISIAALAAIALCFTSVQTMMDRSRMPPPRRVQPVQALQLHDC